MYTLKEKLEYAKKSELYKLSYNNKVLGLRVKLFDCISDKYSYYDFSMGGIDLSADLKEFINSIYSDIKTLPLILDNNLLKTKEEIDNNIIIKEFKSSHELEELLKKLKLVYEMG